MVFFVFLWRILFLPVVFGGAPGCFVGGLWRFSAVTMGYGIECVLFNCFIFTMLIVKSDKPVGICSDHAGYALKGLVESWLRSHGIEYVDFGTNSDASCDYADFAHPCARAVELGECYPGIAMCGSGNGINMTLNKHQGIRAALCWNEELASLARRHNDANVLVMPARFVSDEEALGILEVFLNTAFEGGRHSGRIAKIPLH